MLAKKAAGFALSKKASDIVLMDLRKKSSATDFFVVCSADSDTHAKAIADAVRDGLEQAGSKVWHSEGFQARQWILLDYVDVVVHVFHKSIRSFYSLERLWSDAKIHAVEEDGSGVVILPAPKVRLRAKPKARPKGKQKAKRSAQPARRASA